MTITRNIPIFFRSNSTEISARLSNADFTKMIGVVVSWFSLFIFFNTDILAIDAVWSFIVVDSPQIITIINKSWVLSTDSLTDIWILDWSFATVLIEMNEFDLGFGIITAGKR